MIYIVLRMLMRILQDVLRRNGRQLADIYAARVQSRISPLHALSKRQDSTATSTPEAEIVSASTVIRTVLLPALDLWEILLKRPGMKGILKEDNDAAIRVMNTGRNPTMKQLHRVHGVSISSLHEIVSKDKKALVTLEY